MTNSIAEYYTSELDYWKETLDFNMEKIDEMHEWLEEVLRSNTVTDLAGKVEHHINQLFLCKQNLAKLHLKLNAFGKRIYNDQHPVSNDLITAEIKDHQQQLRTEMHQVEKEFMDVKYDCDSFLADTITAQNSNPRNNSLHNNK